MYRSLLVLILLACTLRAFAGDALPGHSVYQANIALVDQTGRPWQWNEQRGQVQIVSMFYTSCTMVCPMIVDTMKLTAQALPPDRRDRLHLLLVSFDPAKDSVGVLRDYAEKRRLPAPPWTLARTIQLADTRQVAALLGLQYRQLPDGEFNHSSELVLLDEQGRIAARTSVIGRLDAEFVQAVERALADK